MTPGNFGEDGQMTGTRLGQRARAGQGGKGRALIAGATLLALGACTPAAAPPAGGYVAPGSVPGAAPQAGGFLGLRNPFAGLRLGAVDPDLRGRIGGSLDTSGGAGAGAVAGAAAVPPSTSGIVDPFAGQGIAQPDIEGAGASRTAAAATTASTPARAAPVGAAPAARPAGAAAGAAATSHTVAAGETAWSISRRYGVSVADLAAANGLPETMTVRAGQRLAIPAGGRPSTAVATTTAPGTGSPTPQPPSASQPLPREETTPASAPVARPTAPDLGATRTAASGNGRLSMPVSGSIVRAYAKGRNEGIDISAPRGTSVKAAGGGTVAAVTRDTQGVPIVVVRHEGSLMTVYSGLGDLNVAKGDSLSAGETIGTSGQSGVVHFEVRQGFESVDPETYLR